MHGRHHITSRRIGYRIANIWNSSLEVHLAQKCSLALPTAVFPSSAGLGKTACSSLCEPFQRLTLPIWQKHTNAWGICVSRAEPRTTAEPSLGDEGRRAQKTAQKTVMTLLL